MEADQLTADTPTSDLAPAPEAKDDEPLVLDAEDRPGDEVPKVDEQPSKPDLESVARETGWKPKSEWKGDLGLWVDADEHIRRAFKSRDSLKTKVGEREKTLKAREQDFDNRVARLEKTQTALRERQVAAVRANYQALLDEAFHAGDGKRFNEVQQAYREEVAALEPEPELALPVQLSDDDFVSQFQPFAPEVQQPFWDRNSWILEDGDREDRAFEAVNSIIESTIAQRLNSSGAEQPSAADMSAAFREAEAFLRENYEAPRVEEDPPARKSGREAPLFASGSRSGGDSGRAHELPPEALQQAKKSLERGDVKSLDEYAEIYFEDLEE